MSDQERREGPSKEAIAMAYGRAVHCGVGGHDGHTDGDISLGNVAASDRCWLALALRQKEAELDAANYSLATLKNQWEYTAKSNEVNYDRAQKAEAALAASQAAIQAQARALDDLRAEVKEWKDCAEQLSDVANLMGTAREDMSRKLKTAQALLREKTNGV